MYIILLAGFIYTGFSAVAGFKRVVSNSGSYSVFFVDLVAVL
jgi:hypothetical protein